MENATKALLISATILITIVLIAIGVLIIRNMSNTSDDANKVAEEIENATNKASIEALGGLKGTIISKEKFNEIFEDWQITTKIQMDNEISIKNEKLKDQIEMISWSYNYVLDISKNASENEDFKDFPTKNNYSSIKDVGKACLEWCEKKEEAGKITKLSDPLDNDKIKEICKGIYEKKIGNSNEYRSFEDYYEIFQKKNSNKGPIRFSCFWTYDETGYIDKVYYVAYILYYEPYVKK